MLARLGNKTKAAIDLYQTGVPTIIFGDKYNSTLHSLATTNFTEAVCIVDPGACKVSTRPKKNWNLRDCTFFVRRTCHIFLGWSGEDGAQLCSTSFSAVFATPKLQRLFLEKENTGQKKC